VLFKKPLLVSGFFYDYYAISFGTKMARFSVAQPVTTGAGIGYCVPQFCSMLSKRFILSLLPLLAGASLANAQVASAKKPSTTPIASATPTSVESRANALTNNMAQALGLTPAQVEKVRVINTNSVRNVEAARVRFRQDPGKLRGYIEDIGLARLDQLKDVLTPVQFTRYQRKREEKMGIPNVQGVQGNPPPGLGTNE
jgi:hypothetical protein